MSTGESNTKTRFETFLNVCETAAKACLPIVLTNTGLSAVYVTVLMPLCIFLLECVTIFIKRPKRESGITLKEYGKHGWPNQYYEYVAWYVANKSQDTNRVFTKYGWSEEKTATDYYISLYIGSYMVSFKSQIIKIICEDTATNGKVIKLHHISNDLLSEFVLHCQTEYQTRFKRDVKMFTYSSRSWNSTEILNNKLPNYLFISDKLYDTIFNDVAKFIAAESQYKKNCIAWKRGYLFYGAPGCGKTSAILALAHSLKRSIYRITTRECESNSAFETMCRGIPKESIVVFEDIDSLGSVESRFKYTVTRENAVKFIKYRKEKQNPDCNTIEILTDAENDLVNVLCGDNDKSPKTEVLDSFYIDHLGCNLSECNDKQQALCKLFDDYWPAFMRYAKKGVSGPKADTITLDAVLDVLDGNTYFYGCVIIITTNAVERLDPAVTRAGRIEKRCEFTHADATIIRKMYKTYCNRELTIPIPDHFKIAQSKLVHEIFMSNDMDPDACMMALEDLISSYIPAKQS
nr:putative AAA family ATPase [Faustovirus mariensis]